MTSHTSTAIAMPDSHVGIPSWLLSTTAIELGWVNGVVVIAATPAMSAYVEASHGSFRPSRNAYIGPDLMVAPLASRHVTPSTASVNLIVVATKPYAQIQNSAPGPPETMAVATPAILPVPMVPESAVMNAWNGDKAPVVPLSALESIAPNASRNRRTCTTRYRIVRNNPVPNNSTSSQGTNSASAARWTRSARVVSIGSASFGVRRSAF